MLVHVSAKKIGVPDGCICCGGRSDSHYRASHTRSKGKRVVRIESRWWDFPCCTSCLKHVRLFEAAMVMGAFAFIAIGLGILNVYITSNSGPLPGFLGEAQAILTYAFVVGFPLAVGSFLAGQRAYPEKGKSCCAVGAAVTYLGWQGTVQQFIFKSPDYCRRFVTANRGKLVNAHLTQSSPAFDDNAANSDPFFKGF